MPYKIKAELRGKKPKEFMKDVMKNIDGINQAMSDLGDTATYMMASFVMTSTKRQPATGNLANSITKRVTIGVNTSLVGIAEKSRLPPYWYVMNYGMKTDGSPFIPGGGAVVPGSFDGERPDPAYAGVAGGAGARFGKDGRRNMAIKATIPVEPMNYIEQTQAWLDMNWKQYIQSRTRKV
jgi:hypothetical protein